MSRSQPHGGQLARLSLWLATLAADRPLSFLDHHLRGGDSLLGAWISYLRRPPTVGANESTRCPCSTTCRSTTHFATSCRFVFRSPANQTTHLNTSARKNERWRLADRDSPLSKWKRVADLWCARWFAPELHSRAGIFATLCDAILTGRCALPRAQVDQLLEIAETSAGAHRFFHWELEFPEVFFDADGRRRPDGGFDAVVGNPPWDMVRADHGADAHRSQSRAETAAVVRFTRFVVPAFTVRLFLLQVAAVVLLWGWLQAKQPDWLPTRVRLTPNAFTS
jgi:hypothetical protein